MTVYLVDKYEIIEDRVNFSWYTSEPSIAFKKNNFYFEYPGISLTEMSEDVIWSIFLSCFIPVLRDAHDDSDIVFKAPINYDLLTYWATYHKAKNINFTPIHKHNSRDAIEHEKIKNNRHGVLYGGGKDSLFALNALTNMYGFNDVVILSYIFPADESKINDLKKRRDSLMLKPLKESIGDIKQQVISTNIRSVVSTLYLNSFHIGLYSGTMLPACIYHEISFATFSYEYTHYYTHDSNGNCRPYFYGSRTEPNKYISEKISKILGRPFQLYNFNYPISEYFAFKAVSETYTHTMNALTMCEAITAPDKKYCMTCTKCAEYALYNLSLNKNPKDFDYNFFFQNSPYIKNIIDKIDSTTVHKWFNGLSFVLHYQSFKHVINKIDLQFSKSVLNADSFILLNKIKDAYGGTQYDDIENIHLEMIEQLAPPNKELYINELKKTGKISDSKKIDILYGNDLYSIDTTHNENIIEVQPQLEISKFIENILLPKKIPSDLTISTECELCNLTYENNNHEIIFGILDSGPLDKSRATITFKIPAQKNKAILGFKITNQYFNPSNKGRISYVFELNGTVIFETDAAIWAGSESFELKIPKSKNTILTISVVATKDCEAWNWGRSTALKINNISYTPTTSPIENYNFSGTHPAGTYNNIQ